MSDAQPTSRRMQKLRQVLEKVLVESVDSFSFADMHECYPELAKENGNLLSRFCTDLLQGIRYNVVSEFEAIAKENQLDAQLQKLEQLQDSRPKSLKTGKRRVATSALSPTTLLRNHSVREKRASLKDLQNEIEQLEAKNAASRKTSDEKLQALQQKAEELQELRVEVDKQAEEAKAALP